MNYWKVIIVDDDPMVRKGLRHIVNWNSIGFSMEKTCAHGKEALDYLSQHPVDLLITDIKMPVLNGVELIKQIRERSIDVECLVLSGYDDYEFLSEAFRYQVLSYMLKPVDIDELLSNLEASKVALVQKQNHARFYQEGKEALQHSLFQRLILQNIQEPKLRNKIQILGQSHILMWNSYVLGILIVEHDHKRVTEIQHKSITTAQNSIKEQDGIIFLDPKMRVCILSNTEKVLMKIAEELVPRITREYHCSAVLVGGVVSKTIMDLHTAYTLLCDSFSLKIDEYLHNAQSCYLSCSSLADVQSDPEAFWDPEEIEKLVFAGDIACIHKILLSVIDNQNGWFIQKQQLFCLSMYLISAFQRQAKENISVADEMGITPERFSRLDTPEQAKILIDDMCAKIENNFILNKYVTHNEIVNMMIRYVRMNYAKDISVKEYAYESRRNPLYLGTLFQKHTGMKFTSYVQMIRIERAAFLLRETDKKIVQIAKDVGFGTPKYFLKIFQQLTGKTPSDYRMNR